MREFFRSLEQFCLRHPVFGFLLIEGTPLVLILLCVAILAMWLNMQNQFTRVTQTIIDNQNIIIKTQQEVRVTQDEIRNLDNRQYLILQEIERHRSKEAK